MNPSAPTQSEYREWRYQGAPACLFARERRETVFGHQMERERNELAAKVALLEAEVSRLRQVVRRAQDLERANEVMPIGQCTGHVYALFAALRSLEEAERG